jgi:hypothetical protein
MPLPRLFVLGDSISIQYGPYLQAMLAGRFAYDRKTGEEEAVRDLDIPLGANGGDSRMCLAYLNKRCTEPAFKPDIFLLNCGLHDVKSDPRTAEKQVPILEYVANLTAMLDLMQPRCRVVWVRTTPVNEPQHNTPIMTFHRFNADIDRYNARADALMRTRGVASIDLHRFVRTLGPLGDLLQDGRHYHEPIRRLQAAFIAGWLDAHHPPAGDAT